jgi:pSer/pThr/pTyr-binding forkhead associated (FHA) protein
VRTCPFCSTENEAFFRFCLGCGADLDEAFGGEPEAPAPKPGAGEMKGEGAPRAATPDTRVAGPSTAPKPSRPIAQTKDTAVDLPSVSAVVTATKAAAVRVSSPVTAAPVAPAPVPEASPSVAPREEPGPRVTPDRMKTLDPGGAVKPGSVAAQAVAQALVDPARSAEIPEIGPSTNPRPITGSGARAGTPSNASKVVEVATKRAGSSGGPDLPAPVAKKASEGKPKARLVIILEDGTDGSILDLSPEVTVIGREGAEICFPHDDFLARRHAEFYFQNGLLHLKPLESTNGVFLQVHPEVELESGDIFRIGQQLLSFEVLTDVAGGIEPDAKGQAIPLGSPIPEGAWGRLGQLIAPDTMGSVYLLGGTEVYLGRERGDITFPGDGFVSGLHAQISMRNGRCYLKDLGSSNGTYIRLSKPTLVKRGMLVLAGQQLFRVEQ